MGLALLSGLGAAGLQQAITEGDVAALSGVSGIGRRTASRLVLELKGKLELADGDMAAGGLPADADGELIAALTALGYSTAEARRAIANLEKSPEQTLEERLRLVLQGMGGG